MENGRQALEAFEQRFYTFLLTDWVMPEMDGLELCRAIRAKRDQGYVYVILLTHKGSKDDIILGLAGLENLTDADAVTPEKLLNLADENLYQAKEEGRNRVKG